MKMIENYLSKNYQWKYEYKTSYITTNKKDIHIHFTPKTNIDKFITWLSKLNCKILAIWNYEYYGISLKVRTK